MVEQQSASTPAPPRQRSQRKISWDVVRGGCVALVLLYHSTYLGVTLHPDLAPRMLHFPFQVGASSLLVISAYFACVTIGRGTVLRYWINRLARLIPPFIGAVLVIYLLLQFTPPASWGAPTFRELGANLLMLWNWKPQDYAFLDGSHWTVPLQLMGFTAAAVLYKSRWRHSSRIIVIMWAAVLLPLAQWQYRLADPPEWYRTLVDGIGAHRWHLFVAGVAIWMWSTKRLTTPHFTALMASCMLAHGLHNYLFDADGVLVSDWGSTVGVSMVMAVIALTARKPAWGDIIPEWTHRPIKWFAGVSYGVFLTHQTMGYIVSLRLQEIGASPAIQVAGMIGTGLLLGWALTKFVEKPAHRFLIERYDVWERSRLAA